MQPSTRWCVMWSLCELGELVCEPPMAPEPSSRARTREKQDWSWEERRGATGGHSGSPGMWIHYKYITITTTTSNHGSGAGEEGTKHILQVLLSNIYQNNAHYIRYIPSYQTQNKKVVGCLQLEFALYIFHWNSLNIGVAPSTLPWRGAVSAESIITQSHSPMHMDMGWWPILFVC